MFSFFNLLQKILIPAIFLTQYWPKNNKEFKFQKLILAISIRDSLELKGNF